MSANDGGNAFPTHYLNGSSGDYFMSTSEGMSLRDYFAAAALQGLCADEIHAIGMDQKSQYVQIAEKAYIYADAMLRERAK